MTRLRLLDLFCGAGGWSEGLRTLGLDDIGIELDAAACATRVAAGHRTIRADVTRMPINHLAGRVEGLIMSPPCQAFSAAGNGDGRAALGRLQAAIDRGDWARRYDGHEVLEVGRWAETLRPQWLACEQVPPVLPLWQAYAARWRALYGWSCWAGLLCAANYGVPQERNRAILLARADGQPTRPPTPTHCRTGGLFGEAPWVSMDQVLGWGYTDRPARTICGDRSPGWLYEDRDGTHGRVLHTNRDQRPDGTRQTRPSSEPAPSLTAKAGGQWTWDGDLGHPSAERLTLTEALILQSFRPDYPVQGNKTQRFTQVGNAIPPLLAAHVLAAVTGRTLEAAA